MNKAYLPSVPQVLDVSGSGGRLVVLLLAGLRALHNGSVRRAPPLSVHGGKTGSHLKKEGIEDQSVVTAGATSLHTLSFLISRYRNPRNLNFRH